MKGFVAVAVIVIGIFFLYVVGDRDVEFVKNNSAVELERLGYENCVYEGYQLSIIYGGKVWYQCEKRGFLYDFFLMEWNRELHLYNITLLEPTVKFK